MKIFNSVGHLFAWIFSKLAPAASQTAATIEGVSASPLAQAIAALGGAKAQAVEAAIQAIAGDVFNAFGAAGEAIGADGLNVNFDAATVTSIESVYGDLKALFGKSAPATPPAPAAGT